MKPRSKLLLLYILWLIEGVLLVFAAAEKQTDAFYIMLRWVSFVIFACSAAASFWMNRLLWVAIFAALTILFNPVFVFQLQRDTWIVADWLSIGAMVIAGFVFSKDSQG
jgi:hypothetical protein